MIRCLPLGLTLLRLGLAPLVVAIARAGGSPAGMGVCLTAAFLSDVYDGVLARRLGVATPTLRRLDSAADVAFYAGVIVAAATTRPALMVTNAWGLGGVLGLELLGIVVSFARFGRPSGTHAYSAKAWGVVLFATAVAVLCFGGGEWLLPVTIAFGVVAELEVLAILVISRAAPVDVRSVVRAWRTRCAVGAVRAKGKDPVRRLRLPHSA
jgi:CDP-diacylglycerol--glycerol-3-phosphate 3-phosphatidyltransferase